MNKPKDKFLYDEDDTSARARVVAGDIAILEDQRINEQYPRNSLYLKGIVPGGFSQEQSDDEPGWQEISTGTAPKGIFMTAKEIRDVQNRSRKMYNEDSVYSGIIDAFKFFVIGRGLKIVPHDEAEEVKKYLEDFSEANKMDGRDRDVVATGLMDGELYVRFYTKADDRIARIPTIRLFYYWEISRTVKDESGKLISYVRTFYNHNTNDVEEETIPAAEMIHIKFGAVDDDHGLPPMRSILKDVFYYDDWCFNRIVLNRLKTSYYLEEIVEGTPSNVSTVDAATPSANKTTKSGNIIKRMPKPGTKLTHNKAVEYHWLSPDVKADDAKEDGRMIRMRICAGAQCPEFIIGDSSQTNFSSSLTAQNPFVRKIEWLQDFFEAYFKEIYCWVICYGVANKFLKSISTETVTKERAGDYGFIRRIRAHLSAAEQIDPGGNVVTKQQIPTKTTVSVTWPVIIMQKILEETQALQIQQSMDIVSDRTIANKLGYEYDEEMRIKQRDEETMGDEDEPDDDDEELARKRDLELARQKQIDDDEAGKQ